MPPTAPTEILEPFLTAADGAAASRPDVDRETARELMAEAAGMLHDSLALDDLDPHDLGIVVQGLASDLVSVDPGAAVRERIASVGDDDSSLHDPSAARGACLVTLAVLQL